MRLSKLPRAVIFDFDGVMAESNQVKDKAFELLAAEYPEQSDRMLEYHREHMHEPRIQKFRYYAKTLFGKSLESGSGQSLVDELGERFSTLVKNGVVQAKEVNGARELLEFLNQEKIPCYIASTTPHDELQQIVQGRMLDSLFIKVYGNPPYHKKEVIGLVQEQLDLSNTELLFIGDSMADYEAAHSKSVPFWGRVSENHFLEPEARWFKDLDEIRVELLKVKNEM